MASICSVTRKLAITAPIPAPTRPATRSAATNGPISTKNERHCTLGISAVAPRSVFRVSQVGNHSSDPSPYAAGHQERRDQWPNLNKERETLHPWNQRRRSEIGVPSLASWQSQLRSQPLRGRPPGAPRPMAQSQQRTRDIAPLESAPSLRKPPECCGGPES